MKVRFKIFINTILGFLIIFTSPMWVIVWLFTGWKYMNYVEWLFNNPSKTNRDETV